MKVWRYWRFYRQCKAHPRGRARGARPLTYTDLAIAKPNAHEFEELELYHETRGGGDAVRRKQPRRHEPSRRTLAGSPRAAGRGDLEVGISKLKNGARSHIL